MPTTLDEKYEVSQPVPEHRFFPSDRLICHIKPSYVVEDIPQPAPDPYAPGDEVQIYLDPADPDAPAYGAVCEVVDVLADDLDIQTDRPTDAYSYRLKGLETGETLPLVLHHQDLVSAENTQ